MAEAHSGRAHARLAPSAAARWSACPGSVTLEAGFPDSSSTAADEGTAAHELASHCLDMGFDTKRFLGRVINIAGDDPTSIFMPKQITKPDGPKHFLCDDEMVAAVDGYVRLVRGLGQPPSQMLIEKRVNAKQIHDECWGTADAMIYNPEEKHLHVLDLKYGRGVVVEAKENKQAGVYASGARSTFFHNKEIEQITVHIYQPRAPHAEGPHRKWTFDLRHLTGVIEDQMHEAAQDVFRAEESRVDADVEWEKKFLAAGDHCRFCKASAICPAQRDQALSVAQQEFGTTEGEFKEPSKMQPDELATVLTHARAIQHWISDVEKFANAEAQSGRMPTGYKLVAGKKGARKWRDEDQVKNLLPVLTDIDPDECMVPPAAPTLLSPAQLEKKLAPDQRDALKSFVTQSIGASQLVPTSDSRPPLKVDASSEFQPAIEV